MMNTRIPHILIVDDSPEILALLRELFEGEGYQVTTSSAPMGVPSIRSVAPDAIIQDLIFYGSTDESLPMVTEIRHDPELAKIPLVLCTAMAQVVKDDDLAATLDDLGVRVVLKPFDIDQLLDTVGAVSAHGGSEQRWGEPPVTEAAWHAL